MSNYSHAKAQKLLYKAIRYYLMELYFVITFREKNFKPVIRIMCKVNSRT